MAGGAQDKESNVGSPAPKQRGRATVDTLKIGCLAMVVKDGKPRKAEILSIKETKSGRQFYCNFDNFNKRLDEWVPTARIDFTQEVEWPNPEKPKDSKKAAAPATKKAVAQKKDKKRPARTREASIASETSTSRLWPEFSESQKATPDPEGEEKLTLSLDLDATPGAEDDDPMDVDDVVGQAVAAKAEPPEQYSREEEIEKLRVGGSMTQNQAEISRIRNISKVQFGKYNLYPWYFSPYPEAFTQEDLMYICEFCLGYFADEKSFTRHRQKCTLQHPPGNEIYRDDYVSDEKGFHLVGYFSKEKESADGYNVACILTLPQYQRKGYGRLLIQFSYELSSIENKLGSPEKPLSDLGLLSYRQYWTENLLEALLEINEEGTKTSIEALAHSLSMTPADVESTLMALQMQVYHKNEHKIVLPLHLIKKHEALRERQKIKPKRVLDPRLIQWKPPVFTASSRTWGW
ncbi:probable histone acetyltransferase ESA1 [Rhynchosporium agropyri]|uniref:Histone acetyltransferase ESA1 n=1 Tax=Rhynchosporium agropyri TaxID=914238 RepID=A0A1E1JT53_9HELO|nr:probable histone acetyltransferase ESA1 [Rhynchosporium agropyri]